MSRILCAMQKRHANDPKPSYICVWLYKYNQMAQTMHGIEKKATKNKRILQNSHMRRKRPPNASHKHTEIAQCTFMAWKHQIYQLVSQQCD